MKSKPRLPGRRIVAIAAFALAVTATGSASASASPTPTHTTGVHMATAANSSRFLRPGDYYPSQPCNGFFDGLRIAGADGQIWECTYGGGRWHWYPTGQWVE